MRVLHSVDSFKANYVLSPINGQYIFGPNFQNIVDYGVVNCKNNLYYNI